MKDEKIMFEVADGYGFLFLPEIKQPDGKILNFAKRKPALGGEVIEVFPSQIIGQEQKLVRVHAVKMKCDNYGCGKIFDSKIANVAYAYCPKCGGRGGEVVKNVKDPKNLEKEKVKEEKKDPEKVEEVVDTNREEKQPEKKRKSSKRRKTKK